jgi:1-deoxy-D-xylulose-5-phosphate reductoisomerase
MDKKMIAAVSIEDALKHPSWDMGAKISIDSATLMNKGFEVIEAKWLFGLRPEQIEVVIHPQSIIHSMVQFCDGSIKAQLGLPDMRLPIQYALSFPERISNTFPRLDFTNFPQLTFSAPDTKIFRNLALAYEAMQKGGNMACILNAANEIAVEAFLAGKISFPEIWLLNEQIMQKSVFIARPTLDDYIATDNEARGYASEMVEIFQLKY